MIGVLVPFPLVPILVLCAATTTTTLLLYRQPRCIVDVYNSPPPLLLSIFVGFLALPSILAELLKPYFCCQCRQPSRIPPPADPDSILLLPAHVLAQRIRSGTLTSLSLTLQCIERIKQHNPAVNAIVVERFEAALDDARTADRAIAAGTVSPDQLLYGVPIVVKECFELKGYPFTAGIHARKGLVGTKDSPTMDRVRRDGMIIVGTTNVSEGCMFHESCNGVYGVTRNPFDLARTPGGSSGGCAASVAAYFAPLAVTSDVGGSTRLPAFYQGLFGHKPTGGTVPNTGTMPHVPSNSKISRFCQLGPTGRSSYDLLPLLNTLSGRDNMDQMTLSHYDIQSPTAIQLDSTFTVYNVVEPFMPWFARCGLHPELRRAQADMIDVLRTNCKVTVIDIDVAKDLPEMSNAFEIWAAMMQDAQDGVVFGEIVQNNNNCSLISNLLLEVMTCSLRTQKRHTVPALGLALLDNLGRALLSPNHNDALLQKGARLKQKLNALLNNDRCVMICPSVLCPAPRHHENLIRFLSTSQTSIFNVMELPATAVPYFKLSKDGLPLGVQIVGGDKMDHVTIRVANVLEKEGVAGFPHL
jgi:fatty acid amide hydrolase 2